MATQTSPPELRHFLQSLPQELYDQVFLDTFIWPSQVVRVNDKLKYPDIAHVDRWTREHIKRQLLAGSIFIGDVDDILKWVGRLSSEERESLQDVRCWIYGAGEPRPRSSMAMLRVRAEYQCSLGNIDDGKGSSLHQKVKIFGSERAVLETVRKGVTR